jgi:hypothetical protein
LSLGVPRSGLKQMTRSMREVLKLPEGLQLGSQAFAVSTLQSQLQQIVEEAQQVS